MISLTLHQIHPATILPQATTGFNVYLSNRDGERPVKFLSCDKTVDATDCDQLRDNSDLRVFIDASSLETYRDYLVTHSNLWLTDDRLPNQLRNKLLLECMLSKWQASIGASDFEATIDSARQLAEMLKSSIDIVGVRVPDILSSVTAGTDLARHSLRTAIYCVLLGNAMGYDRSILTDLCMGGLLHDIGKAQDQEQYSTLTGGIERSTRSHPLFGFRRLCPYAKVPMTVLMMCYQHHENVDGSGFPVRLIGDEIHFGARICAIANRFDHMTNNDNPRLAYSMGSAGRIMEQDRSNRFDQDMMKIWLKLLKNHLKKN
ncbi:MAG: HD-GYP domain-containing protein [Planctomycetota bacterium]|jgi:HD-GYP domain-containing protein (c-di-GMP phosphodiesterase class II)